MDCVNALEGTLLDLVARALDTPVERLDQRRLRDCLRDTLRATDWSEDDATVGDPEPGREVDALIEARVRRAWQLTAALASEELGVDVPPPPNIAVASGDAPPGSRLFPSSVDSSTLDDGEDRRTGAERTIAFDSPRHLSLELDNDRGPPHRSQAPLTEDLAEIADNARRNSSVARRAPTEDALIGTTLKGKYRIARALGRGGAGTVYEAEDLHIGAKVAVKFLHPEAARRADAIEGFVAEAKLLTTVDHENIVRWITFDETDDGAPYFVMEYLHGSELSTVLSENGGALPWRRAVRIALQVLHALERAHDLPNGESLLHLDLKPQNVFVLEVADHEHERIKVIDFGIGQHVGIAVEVGPNHAGSPSLAGVLDGVLDLGATFTVIAPPRLDQPRRARGGTPLFSSPEQASHLLNLAELRPLDGRSDIYSLGIMLFYMISGEFPYPSSTDAGETLAAHIETTPKRLKATGARVPKRIDEFVDRCLRKDPDDRWTNTSAARAHLERIVQPPRKAVTALVVAVLLLASLAGWLGWPDPKPFELHIAEDDVVLFGQRQPTRGEPVALAVPINPTADWSVVLHSADVDAPTDATAVVIHPASGDAVPIEASYLGDGRFELRSTAKERPAAKGWIQVQLRADEHVTSSRQYWVEWIEAPDADAIRAWIDEWQFQRNADGTPTIKGVPTAPWDPGHVIALAAAPDQRSWRRVEAIIDGTVFAECDILADRTPRLSLAKYLESNPLGPATRTVTLGLRVIDLCGQSATVSVPIELPPLALEFADWGVSETDDCGVPRLNNLILGPMNYMVVAKLNRPGRLDFRLLNQGTGEVREINKLGGPQFRAPIDELFPSLQSGKYELTVRPFDPHRREYVSEARSFGFEWREDFPDIVLDIGGDRILAAGKSVLVNTPIDVVELRLARQARRVHGDVFLWCPDDQRIPMGEFKLDPEQREWSLTVALAESGRYELLLGIRNNAADQNRQSRSFTILVDAVAPEIEWFGTDEDQLAGQGFKVTDVPFDEPHPEVRVRLGSETTELSWGSATDRGWSLASWVPESLPDGTHTLVVTARDFAGNETEKQFELRLNRNLPVIEDRTGSGDWPVRAVTGPESWVRRWDLAYASSEPDIQSVSARITIEGSSLSLAEFDLIKRDGVYRTPDTEHANVPPSWAGRNARVVVTATDHGGRRFRLTRTSRVPDRSALPLPRSFTLADRQLFLIDPLDPEHQMEGRVYEFGGRRREQEFPHFNHDVPPIRQRPYYLSRRPEFRRGVSWSEARESAVRLGARLPTWYEWEFATRGGRRYWSSYAGSKLVNHDEQSQLAWSYEWTGSPWAEGTPRSRRQHETIESMIFGRLPEEATRFVVVTGDYARFEPTARDATTVSDGTAVGYRLALDVEGLGLLLEREWGLRP